MNLCMGKEYKTVDRILKEIKKNHDDIDSAAVRNGRIFQYKYFLKS